MIYLYAITDQPTAAMPSVSNLATGANQDRSPLFGITYQDIAAVVSSVASAEVQPTEDNLWLHETVVEALMADRAVLPVRFGTVVPSEAVIQEALAAHYASLAANLDRVRGRVELGLRVLWEEELGHEDTETRRRGDPARRSIPASPHLPISPSPTPAGSGRSYLLARLEEERQERAGRERAESLAAQVHLPLANLAVESTRQVLVTPRLLLTAAYLVEKDQVTTFRRAVESLSAAYPDLRFLCTGPWPAYSFVAEENKHASS
jgi:hypothetical protein